MRTRRLIIVACALMPVRPLTAQSSQCASQAVAVRDACQKGTDVFAMFAPQVSGALAGGGPVLGTARTVEGLSLTLRLNAVDGQVPDLADVPLSAAGLQRRAIATRRAPVPVPALDAALSVVPGFRAGRYRLLSADVLVSAVYMPERDLESFSVRTSRGRVKTTFGARVGLMDESRWLPALSVSFLRRSLPITTLATSVPINANVSAAPDSIELAQMSVRADAFRVAVSKRFAFVEVGGGVGQDRLRHFAQLRTRVTPVVLSAPLAPVASAYVLTQSLTRQSAYGTLAINLGRFHVGAEMGAAFGGDSVTVYNTFPTANLNEARPYGSLGLRYRF